MHEEKIHVSICLLVAAVAILAIGYAMKEDYKFNRAVGLYTKLNTCEVQKSVGQICHINRDGKVVLRNF